MSLPRPKDTDLTRDIAKNGIDALRRAREARQYGALTRQEQLQKMAMGGQRAPRGTQQYDQFREARGFGSMDYAVTGYGRGDGKYSGFDNRSDLMAATQGYGEYQQSQDRSMAAALEQLANQHLDSIDSQWTKNREANDARIAPLNADITHRQVMPHPGYEYKPPSTGGGGFGARGDASPRNPMESANEANMTQDARGRAELDPMYEYQQALNDWAGSESSRYVDAIDTAQAVRDTPLRDYELSAAQAYGVDPFLAAGWFDQSSQLSDASNQRDLESMQQFGMPFDEYQKVLDQMQSDAEGQQEAYTQYDEQAMNDAIYSITSMDPKALASAAQVPADQLYNIIASPDYQQGNEAIGQAVNANNQEQIDTLFAEIKRRNPVLARVLDAQWSYLND